MNGINQTDEISPRISGTIVCAEVDAMSDMTYDPIGQETVV
jgi:hypothetical protein